MELRLNSPVGGSPAVYYWPLNKKKGYDEAKEIIETIVWGCKDIPDLEVPLKRNILKNVDRNDYESMKALTKRYNKAINNVLSLEKGTQKFCDRLDQLASKELLHHIIQQTYSAAVTNAEELNRYEPFSPYVYGETSFDLIAQVIDHIKLTKDDVFVDLGSGVGQVILQVAATAMCNVCIGIERADVPAKYAKAMEKKFKFWMQWYGKKYGPFELIHGDFFDDIHREKFSDATVLFVNNFAFGPSVDHKLKQRFAELKHGTKIVSSKSFCPLNFRITDRNLSDIGTIMNISEITPPTTSSVSWTSNHVLYYLQQIDRTKLENYFRAKKNGSLQTFASEGTERSSDSFDTTDSRGECESYLVITPPPKKRGRKAKLRKSESPILKEYIEDITPKINGNIVEPLKKNNIIRPSKLILNIPSEAIPEIPKRKRGRKRKEASRSCSPDFDSANWVSQGNLRTYSRRSLDNRTGPSNGPLGNVKHMSMQGNLKDLMENFKRQYAQMVGEMSDPLYKTKLKKLVEEETIKNMYLKMKVVDVNQEIENIIVNMQNHILQATAK